METRQGPFEEHVAGPGVRSQGGLLVQLRGSWGAGSRAWYMGVRCHAMVSVFLSAAAPRPARAVLPNWARGPLLFEPSMTEGVDNNRPTRSQTSPSWASLEQGMLLFTGTANPT